LGTNIISSLLEKCKDSFGQQFLQKAKLKTPWYLSFRTIVLRDKELKKNNDRIAILRSAIPCKIMLQPNSRVDIQATTDRVLKVPRTTAMLHETKESNIPSFIDVTPGIVDFEYGKHNYVVTLSNLTTETVTVSPKAILCELQPVTITDDTLQRKEAELAEIELDKKRDKIIDEMKVNEDKILTPEQESKLKNLLRKHKDIMSTGDLDIGKCDVMKHRIDMYDDTPIKQRHRRIPPAMVDEVRQHLEQLLTCGIIRPSKSPWASPIVLVRKKSGKLRMCTDLRLVNLRTIKDSYALPRMDEIFDCLQGARYFSTIDMKSGYNQIEIEEEHKERTGFTVGALGFYEYNRMPFGLSNSPSFYQRVMEEILGDFNMNICVIYIDDLIVFSSTYEEHLERLDMIMERLKAHNIKLAPEKCHFFKERVTFLGHVVSEEGISTDPEKIEKIRNWPTPNNPDELRSFLAFAGYYRRFIKGFSKVTRPLADLIPPISSKKGPKKADKSWSWTEVEQDIFEKLKDILTSPPILAYPNFELPFELHVDASMQALGAVLYQEQEGQKRVIAYASRALSKSEKNYSAYKLEFLALKWAVTEKFSDYLALQHFVVLTDNNPLTYVLSSAKLDATGQRWASALGEYNFDLIYRAGLKNIDADSMSRYPYQKLLEKFDDLVKLEDSTVKTVCSVITIPPLIEILPVMNINIVEATEDPSQPMAQIEMTEIRRRQRQDYTIEKWRKAVIDQKLPLGHFNKGDQIMKKHFHNLKMKRGILFRTAEENNQKIEQLVLPEYYRKEVMRSLHNDVGHPGKERTLRLLKERFFWPGMTTDANSWVEGCSRCLRRKTVTSSRAPLVSVNTSYPLELVCFDFLTLEPSKGGIANILVITDHFTKYAVAVPTKNQTAKTTAEAFYNNFVLNYGIPTRLHSDQGANFESGIISEMCRLANIKKSHTTPYHPMGNAGPERFNRTLLGMLGTLENSQKADWKKYIGHLVYSYNCTPHESTRTSPFELMYGRKPKLPIDAAFESVTDSGSKGSTREYIENLQNRMQKTQEIVQKHMEKAKSKMKYHYDKKAKAAIISEGDKVMVKILAFDGKHKIADKFEEELYDVVRQKHPDIPVFIVKGTESGKTRILHRNHLYPVADQDMDETETKVPQTLEGGRVVKESSKENQVEEIGDVTEDESDEESGYDVVAHTHVHGDACDPEGSGKPAEDKKSAEDKSSEPEEVITVGPSASSDTGEGKDEGTVLTVDTEAKAEEPETIGTDLSVEDTVVVDVDLDNEDVVEDDTPDHPKSPEKTVRSKSGTSDIAPGHFSDTDEGKEESVTSREPPVPFPRRSIREKKPPDRYKDYHVYAMTQRTSDPRLHALDTLMSSGILQSMDMEMTKKILEAVMK